MQPIKIEVGQSFIPVEILGKVYKFHQSDEALLGFEEGVKEIQDKLQGLNTEKYNSYPLTKQFELAHKVLEEGYEFLFKGQDTYKDLKGKIDSTSILLEVFTQVMVQLTDEMNKRKKVKQQQRARQYVNKKKNRPNNKPSNRG